MKLRGGEREKEKKRLKNIKTGVDSHSPPNLHNAEPEGISTETLSSKISRLYG